MLIWVLMTASLLLLAGIIFYPVINTMALSFQSLNLADPFDNHWVGLDNYGKILLDPVFGFWSSVQFSLVFSVCATVVSFVIGLAFALLLNQRLHLQLLWRGLALVPWVLPYVVVAYLFFYMFNSQYGIINHLLTSLDLFGWRPFPQPLGWFGGTGKLAVVATIFAAIWNKFPFFTLMLLAGLQNHSPDLLDGATVGGAQAWCRFLHVTFAGPRRNNRIPSTLPVDW